MTATGDQFRPSSHSAEPRTVSRAGVGSYGMAIAEKRKIALEAIGRMRDEIFTKGDKS
jgi:hypothetical protein